MLADASRRGIVSMPSLAILVGVHLALDLTLTRHGWFWDQSMLMIALAIPLSQIALLAILAAVVSTSQRPP